MLDGVWHSHVPNSAGRSACWQMDGGGPGGWNLNLLAWGDNRLRGVDYCGVCLLSHNLQANRLSLILACSVYNLVEVKECKWSRNICVKTWNMNCRGHTSLQQRASVDVTWWFCLKCTVWEENPHHDVDAPQPWAKTPHRADVLHRIYYNDVETGWKGYLSLQCYWTKRPRSS